MLRPLTIDLLSFALPLGLGILLFTVGRLHSRWPKPVRVGVVCLAIGVVAFGAVTVAGLFPGGVNAVVSGLGGATILLSWAALVLLGIVWNLPNRSLSSGFLGVLVLVALILLGIESSGRLWWRFAARDLWDRTANAKGCLRQSSGVTCSPVAAVMLLASYGIAASEGEMAYLANSSLFGTDAYSVASALGQKVYPRGWHAQVEQADYQTCLHGRWCFVAHVHRPDVGGHAVFVERVLPEQVTVIDPLEGQRQKLSRAEFEEQWDGVVIRVITDRD